MRRQLFTEDDLYRFSVEHTWWFIAAVCAVFGPIGYAVGVILR